LKAEKLHVLDSDLIADAQLPSSLDGQLTLPDPAIAAALQLHLGAFFFFCSAAERTWLV
jgi:hypothetical protein